MEFVIVVTVLVVVDFVVDKRLEERYPGHSSYWYRRKSGSVATVLLILYIIITTKGCS